MGFLQEPTVQAFILPKSSIRESGYTGLRQNTCLHSGLLQKPQAPMPCQCQFDILSSRREVVINDSYSITPSRPLIEHTNTTLALFSEDQWIGLAIEDCTAA